MCEGVKDGAQLAGMVPYYLNGLGKNPRNRPLPFTIEYPEPGVLRIYCGADVAAWCDRILDEASFRPKVA